MKRAITFFLLCSSFTVTAQELDKSTRMDNLLSQSGVDAWGKRKSRDATIVCKIPKKTLEVECHLRSSGADWSSDVYKEFKGDEAVALSNLLKEFKQFPSGNRSRQVVDIICMNEKNSTAKVCEVQEDFEIIGI